MIAEHVKLNVQQLETHSIVFETVNLVFQNRMGGFTLGLNQHSGKRMAEVRRCQRGSCIFLLLEL